MPQALSAAAPPTAEAVPTGQLTQVAELVAPVDVEYVPGAQGVQEAAAGPLQVPGGHVRHAPAQYVPATQVDCCRRRCSAAARMAATCSVSAAARAAPQAARASRRSAAAMAAGPGAMQCGVVGRIGREIPLR